MKKNVKMVVITSEKIKNPDFKFIHEGRNYKVSIKNRTIPMVENPEFVEKFAEFLELHKNHSENL